MDRGERNLGLGGAIVILVLGACSAAPAIAPATNSSGTGAPSVLPAPSVSQGNTPPSSPLAAPGSSFVPPSGGELPPSEDRELEARLPDSFNGVPLLKSSYRGDTILGDPRIPSNADLRGVVASLGRKPDDYTVALAVDPTLTLGATIGAIRLAGVDGNVFLSADVAFNQRTTPGLLVAQAHLGGKDVTAMTDPATLGTEGPTYIYPSGDTLFFVTSADPALAAAALAVLPEPGPPSGATLATHSGSFGLSGSASAGYQNAAKGSIIFGTHAGPDLCSVRNAADTLTANDPIFFAAVLKHHMDGNQAITLRVTKDGKDFVSYDEPADGTEFDCYGNKDSLGTLDVGVYVFQIINHDAIEASAALTIK
jgi:hypothetical protein